MACSVAAPLAGVARHSHVSSHCASSEAKAAGSFDKCRMSNPLPARRMTGRHTRKPADTPEIGTGHSRARTAGRVRSQPHDSLLPWLGHKRRLTVGTGGKVHSRETASGVLSCRRKERSSGEEQGPLERASWLSDLALLRLLSPSDWLSLLSQNDERTLRRWAMASLALIVTLTLSQGPSRAASDPFANNFPAFETHASALHESLTPGPRGSSRGMPPPNQISTVCFIFGGPSTETTSAGLVLPREYASSAREVASKLRESLQAEGGGKDAKFREKAEAAKGAIRLYIQQWKGKGVENAQVRGFFLSWFNALASSATCLLGSATSLLDQHAGCRFERSVYCIVWKAPA